MKINEKEAADFLSSSDRIVILSHQSPDGDTMGSAFALYYSLIALGKRVRLECADGFPERFCLFGLPEFDSFEPDSVVAVDIADSRLLGDALQKYASTVDLCIDHHPTNTAYAKRLLLDETAAATCEIIYRVIKQFKMPVTKEIASCLYMGISTDTGCFKFSNTTPKTHEIAAELMRLGADYPRINVRFFETKSRSRIMVERMALESMRFYFHDRCAVLVISREMIQKTGADDSELDGVSAIPRQIEGVHVGVTIREKDDHQYKISMRSGEQVDVSKICGMLGGGGHMRASGCVLKGDFDTVLHQVLTAIADFTKWDGEMA